MILDYTHFFRIDFEAGKYQTLRLKGYNPGSEPDVLLNGRRFSDKWKAPKVEVANPEKERADFLWLPPNTLVARQHVAKVLDRTLIYQMEWLPLDFKEEKLVAINPRTCAPCLDLNNSVVERDPATNKITAIKEYAFIPYRVPGITLFKVPQLNGLENYCHSGYRAPEDDFKATVHRNDFTGLRFTEIWRCRTEDVFDG